MHYPFQIERENREPKMCNPIGYDREKQALICESEVVQGSRLRFSTPPDFDIIETVTGKAEELKTINLAEADALLIFSCAGRLSALGPMAQEENEGLQKYGIHPWPDFILMANMEEASTENMNFIPPLAVGWQLRKKYERKID